MVHRLFAGFVVLLALLSMVGCVSLGPEVVDSFGESYRVPAGSFNEVVVSAFEYTTYRETATYAGSTGGGGVVYDTFNVLQEYGGGDVSSLIANVLAEEGVKAVAKKDVGPSDLEEGQVLLTGSVNMWQYGSFQPWHVVPFFVGIGNILPAPWGFKVGAQVDYSAELIAADGTILKQIPGKSARALYNHLWVWGALARAKTDFYNASDIIGPQAVAEILSIFGLE